MHHQIELREASPISYATLIRPIHLILDMRSLIGTSWQEAEIVN
jgi:hypothetical protein